MLRKPGGHLPVAFFGDSDASPLSRKLREIKRENQLPIGIFEAIAVAIEGRKILHMEMEESDHYRPDTLLPAFVERAQHSDHAENKFTGLKSYTFKATSGRLANTKPDQFVKALEKQRYSEYVRVIYIRIHISA